MRRDESAGDCCPDLPSRGISSTPFIVLSRVGARGSVERYHLRIRTGWLQRDVLLGMNMNTMHPCRGSRLHKRLSRRSKCDSIGNGYSIRAASRTPGWSNAMLLTMVVPPAGLAHAPAESSTVDSLPCETETGSVSFVRLDWQLYCRRLSWHDSCSSSSSCGQLKTATRDKIAKTRPLLGTQTHCGVVGAGSLALYLKALLRSRRTIECFLHVAISSNMMALITSKGQRGHTARTSTAMSVSVWPCMCPITTLCHPGINHVSR